MSDVREPGSERFTANSPSILRIRPEHRPTQPHNIVQLAMDNMCLEYEPGEGFHTTRRGFARALDTAGRDRIRQTQIDEPL